MIRIAGRFATYGELWFDEAAPSPAGVDVLMFRRRAAPIENQRCLPFVSLVNDLSAEEHVIRAAFARGNRAHISRAEKEALECEFLPEPGTRLCQFSAFYNAFAQQKALQPIYRRGLAAASEAGQLVLSCARHAGVDLVWHAYIVSAARVSLLHSASHFRNKQHDDRRIVGRANRWLHWKDMLNFRQLGMRQYDWGGIFEDESDPMCAGINNFKREFGGIAERRYDADVPLTLRGRAYLAARRTLGSVGKS